MKQRGTRNIALLLTVLLLAGTAAPAAFADSGTGIQDYERTNLEQRTVLTPQEEIAPELTSLPSLEGEGAGADSDVRDDTLYSSPLDIAAANGSLYVADYTAKCIRVVEASSNERKAGIPLPESPNTLLASADGTKVYAGAGGADGHIYVIDTASGAVVQTLEAGHTPSALELSADGGTLYAANRFDGTLQVIDLASGTTTATVYATREPMSMVRAGTRLFLASHLITGSAQQNVVASDVVCFDLTAADLSAPASKTTVKLLNGSTNVKDMAVSPDGAYVYVSHALGRFNVATTQADRGWIYNNAVTELRVADGTVTAVMLLDDLDWGAGNPWGIAATDTQLFVAISGTRELMAIDRTKMRQKIDEVTNGTYWSGKNQSLSYQGFLQEKDDIANDLTFLTEMKTRIPLGQDGPRGLAVSGGTVYTANYFSGSVSAVNAATHVKNTISFGSAPEDDVRTGERLWNDATIGYQQWQSCASCHPDARVDGLNWDNLNDGIGTPKQARSMLYTFKRGRVMATGIRANAKVAVRAGLKYIMFNAAYPESGLEQIDAYLQALRPEPSPWLENGRLSQSALRGKALFEGEAGCAGCHAGELKGKDTLIFNYTQTDNETRGLLVPPLVEAWRTAPYLYDGRAATVKEVLTTYNPGYSRGEGRHGNVSGLSSSQLDDVVNYVMSLSTETATLSASASSVDFGTSRPGYGAVAARAVTVGGFQAGELSGATAKLQDGARFTLNASVDEPNQSMTLQITPKEGLASGTYTDTVVVSASSGASAAVTLRFAVTGELKLTGTPAVGETLSIETAGFSPAYRWQWYRGASAETMVPIGNAVKSTYVLSSADEGLLISARGEAADQIPLGSDAVGPIKRGGNTARVSVSGTPLVGQTLRAELAGAAGGFTCRWEVNGAAAGSGDTYTVQSGDAGKEIVLIAAAEATGAELRSLPLPVPTAQKALAELLVKDGSGAVVEGAEVTCTAGTALSSQSMAGPRSAAARTEAGGNLPGYSMSAGGSRAAAAGMTAAADKTAAAGKKAMSGKTAAADTSITAETDANGRALLVLSAGDWTVRAEQNGQTVSKTIAVGDGQLGQKLTVPLSLSAGQTYTLDGTYERAGDYGALAELLDARGNTVAVSDQRGERAAAFHLEAPAGSYTLVLSKPGHLKLTVTDLELKENLRINSASALSLIPGDVRADANERIDFLDIAAMSGAFAGQFRIWDVPDIDGDGFFTVKDMTYVRENYGRTAQTLSFPDLQQ